MRSLVDQLGECCATCRNWDGPVATVRVAYEHNPISMSITDGWPESGVCKDSGAWMEVIIHGDAWLEIEFDANYCCNRYVESDS